MTPAASLEAMGRGWRAAVPVCHGAVSYLHVRLCDSLSPPSVRPAERKSWCGGCELGFVAEGEAVPSLRKGSGGLAAGWEVTSCSPSVNFLTEMFSRNWGVSGLMGEAPSLQFSFWLGCWACRGCGGAWCVQGWLLPLPLPSRSAGFSFCVRF